jgi:hypothetical protein
MASIPLPALSVRSNEQSPLDTFAKLQTIKQLMGQQQLQQSQLQTQGLQQTGISQENQQRALQLQDQQTLRSLAPKYVTKDSDGNIKGFDFNGFVNEASGSGVNPATLQQMTLQHSQAVKAIADADEATRNNEIAKNKQAYEVLEGVRGQKDPQAKQAAYQQGLQSLGKLGVDTSKYPQQVPPDDMLNTFEAGLGMHAQALADAKEQSETAKNVSQQKQADVETALKNVTLERIQNSKPGAFDDQIDKLAPANSALASFNAPLKTAVNGALSRGDWDTANKILTDGFNQIGDINKETNPSVIDARGKIAAATAAASENARLQFGNNKDARDKIESDTLKPYQQKMSEIGELQSAIGQAQTGNIAAARATLYKVIGVAQPQGTHRVAPTEVSGFSGMGSIPERIRGSIANALSGDPWTPQMVQDIKDFGTAQAQVAQDNLNRGIDTTNKLYNTNVGSGLKQAGTQGNASATKGAPTGATHIGIGSQDKKKHYLDANGKDLGLAE